MAFVSAICAYDYYGFSIALPIIGRTFGTSTSALEWIVNAYFIAMSTSLVVMGRMADNFGRRRIAMVGAGVLAAASFLAAASSSLAMLLAARALVGLSVAAITATAPALVTTAFEGRNPTSALGLWSAIGTIGSALGPFAGGVFVDVLDWRWFFLTQGTMCLAGLLLLSLVVEETETDTAGKRIDFGGLATFAAGMVLIIVGLELFDRYGASSAWVVVCLVVGVAMAIVFYIVERIVALPLVDFALFRERDFSGLCLLAVWSRLPYGALILFFVLFLQHVSGLSALHTGMIFLTMMVPSAIASIYGSHLVSFVGVRQALAIAVAFIALSYVSFGFFHPWIGFGLVYLGLALMGIGQGLLYSISAAAGMGAVPTARRAQASGILSAIRAMSMALGVACAGLIFKLSEKHRLSHLFDLAGQNVSADERQDIQQLLSGSDAARAKIASLVPAIAGRVDLVVDEAFAHAFRNVMFFAAAISVLAIISTFILRSRPAQSHSVDTAKIGS
jgi:MFS family permease